MAGTLDSDRQATIDSVRTLIRVMTAPIGSIQFRSRRILENIGKVGETLNAERRGVSILRALDDPELAEELIKSIGLRPPRPSTAARAAQMAAPGLASGAEPQ